MGPSDINFFTKMLAESEAMKETVVESELVSASSIQLTEAELTMPRRKPRSLVVSLSYRLVLAGKYLFGRKRLMRWCLNASWLLRRFAFELGSEVFGSSFQTDARALSKDVLRKWVTPDATVLDIGCGPGRLSRLAAGYAGRVVGIDQSPADIETARQMSDGLNIEYVVGDVTVDLSDSRFDVAMLVHVIEHIDDVDHLLTAIRKIASLLIIEVPDFEADPLNMARHALGCPYYSDGDHLREYSLPMLEQQLERNGWNIQYQERRHGAILAVAGHATPAV
jgi:2-polyprenyl-3-methyl-5-hydroxy-6-metoxy-1,4-benzoquinol methylase